MADVFAAGDAQKDAAQNILSVGNLPAIVDSYQENNLNPYNKSPRNNYGRNLGAISTLGGDFSLPDDSVQSGVQTIGSVPREAGGKISPKLAALLNTDTDNRVGETIDIAQSSLVKEYANAIDAVNERVRSAFDIGDEGIELFGTKTGLFAKDVKLGVLDDYRASDFRKDPKLADKLTGVKEETREAQEALNEEFNQNFEAGNIFSSVVSVAKNVDRLLADSAGIMATLAIPVAGVALATNTRLADQKRTFTENNNREMTGEEELQAAGGIFATLYYEQLLIKAGLGVKTPFSKAPKEVREAFGRVVPKSKTGRAALGITSSTVGEGLQESAEFVQEELATQEVDARTIGEIVADDNVGKSFIQGAVAGGTLRGVGEATKPTVSKIKAKVTAKAEAVKEQAKKVKDTVSTGTNYAKSAFQANPDIDADRLKAAEKSIKTAATTSINDTTGDLEDTSPSEPVARDVEAEVAVLDAKRAGSETMESLDAVEEGDNAKLTSDSKDFDNALEATFSNARGDLAEVAAAREAGDETDYTAGLKTNMTEDIHRLISIAESAEKNGAGPNKLAAMKNAIEELIPLSQAQTTEELVSIIKNTKDPEVRIANIIGSSAASLEQVETAIASGEGTAIQKSLLELKKSALKTGYKVRKEKLIGGGKKPGVIQWANTLAKGRPNDTTISKITDFVKSQQAKIGKFSGVLSAWDRENNMPWTLEENKGKEYSDNPASINNKIAIRNATASKEARADVELTVGGKTYRGLETIAALADSMIEEQVELDTLLKITNEVSGKTSSATQEGTKEAPKAAPVVDTPVEETKAPEPVIEDIAEEIDTTQALAEIREEPIATQDELDASTAEADAVIEKVKKAKAKVPKKPVKAQTPKEEPSVVEEVAKAPDYSNLTPSEQKWMIAYDKDQRPIKPIKTRQKRARLEAKAKIIKKPAETQASKVKEAADVPIGGSEEETVQAVKDAFKKGKVRAEDRQDLTAEDVAELERANEADKKLGEEEVAEVAPVEKQPVKEEVTTKTSIDTVTLNEELADINDDIRWLELEKENETFAERVKTNKKIAALEKKADKIVAALELEGTVGDSILSNEPSQKTKTGLVKGEKAVKLSDFFNVKKVYNNLNTAKDLFGKSFAKLSETIELKEGEAKYLTGSKKLIQNTEKYIRRFITRGLDQTNIKALDITDNKTGAFQSLTRLLLEGEPGNYTLPNEVVTAMAIANNDWMVNASMTRGSKRTNEDTNRLLGKQADDPITQEEIDRVAGIDGLVTTAANSIGSMIYKNIGLKVKPVEGENREVTEAKFKTELGLMAMATMEDNNFIEINKVKAVDVFGKDTVSGGDTEINTFVFTENGNRLLDAKGNPLSSGTRFANKILGTETSMRYPDLEAPKAPRKVTNSSEIGEHFEAAKTTVDAVNMQENTSWEWTEGFMDSYFSMVSTPAGKQKLKELLGWKDSTKVHDKVKPNVNGKNAAIERDMDFMEEWYGQMKAEEKTEMWFPYKLVKNGRFILDANTFNPQGKKLHRFAINISPRKVTKKIVDDHEMSLAMAFGVDIDKQSKKSALAEWDVIKPQLSKMIADSKTDLEILTESVNNGWMHDVEHTMGGVAEFKAYDKYVKDNGSSIGFESRLPIETDAVTSGFILKMLQMPIIKNVNDFLAKGGVFTTFTEDTSYGKQAEQKGYKDAYNTPAQEMQKRIPKVLKSLGDRFPEKGNRLYKEANKRAVELALKSGLDGIVEISRNFMKSPFMTFNYGSSVGNIIKAISDDSIESLYEKMAEEDVSEVIAVIKASGVGMRNDKDAGWVAKDGVRAEVQLARDEAKKFAAMSPKQRLGYTIPDALISNIESNISASIGVALDETFEATYGDFIEAGRTINNSFTTMFRLFKQRLDRDIEAKQKEFGRYLTGDETNAIIDTLKASMPAIETALGDEASKMFIFKTEATNYDKLEGMTESGQGKVRLADNKTLSGQAKKYDMIESYASGAVVPIHYIDGSIQSIVLSEIEALGVHDANMFYADNVVEGTKLYNKGTSQVSTEYSLTTEILNSFNESINAASTADVEAVNSIYANENTGDPETAPTVESMHHDMTGLNTRSEAGRKELFSSPIRFEHAAYEGAHYDWNTESKPYEVQVPKTAVQVAPTKEPTGEITSSIDTAQDSAIIPDIEVDGLDTKFIAAEVAKTTNKINKCIK